LSLIFSSGIAESDPKPVSVPMAFALSEDLLGTWGRAATLTIMTYENDLNTNRRSDMHDDARYTTWIIGGVVTLAIVIAAAVFISTGNYLALEVPQIITTAPAPAPSTTGSDTAR
jgi:hypothetical protein